LIIIEQEGQKELGSIVPRKIPFSIPDVFAGQKTLARERVNV
jgi:hypothetical protein